MTKKRKESTSGLFVVFVITVILFFWSLSSQPLVDKYIPPLLKFCQEHGYQKAELKMGWTYTARCYNPNPNGTIEMREVISIDGEYYLR